MDAQVLLDIHAHYMNKRIQSYEGIALIHHLTEIVLH